MSSTLAKKNDTVRSKVFFEIDIAGQEDKSGRVEFELYDDYVPKTAANFKALCCKKEGAKADSTGKPMSYQGSPFHRVIQEFMLQGGDYQRENGTGGESIYGGKFPDENFEIQHTKAGLLSMANAGPGTNGSQFFITTVVTSWLDGKHVVFGEVTSGMDVVKNVEKVGSRSGQTSKKVTIKDCGVIEEAAADASA